MPFWVDRESSFRCGGGHMFCQSWLLNEDEFTVGSKPLVGEVIVGLNIYCCGHSICWRNYYYFKTNNNLQFLELNPSNPTYQIHQRIFNPSILYSFNQLLHLVSALSSINLYSLQGLSFWRLTMDASRHVSFDSLVPPPDRTPCVPAAMGMSRDRYLYCLWCSACRAHSYFSSFGKNGREGTPTLKFLSSWEDHRLFRTWQPAPCLQVPNEPI